MSTDNQSIFNQDTSQSASTDANNTSQSQTTQSTVPQELVELVGEGKKYKSIDDALKSVPHAQTHISKLESELAQLKEEVSKRKAAEQILEEIKASSNNQSTTTTVPSGVTEDIVKQLVQQQLTETEQTKVRQSNVTSVVNKFKEKFGDKSEETYTKLASDTGLSIAQLNTLAATSPSAVLKLAGLDSSKTTPVVTHPTSSINTEGFKPTGNTELSAKVRTGASTKELVAAWRNAGQKVGKTN